MWCSGEQEAKPAGPLAASCQLQQTADPVQHRGHLEQTVCEAKLHDLWHGSSNFVLGEAPSVQHPSVQPSSPHPDLSALRAGGTCQQDIQRVGSQRFTGCRRYISNTRKYSWSRLTNLNIKISGLHQTENRGLVAPCISHPVVQYIPFSNNQIKHFWFAHECVFLFKKNEKTNKQKKACWCSSLFQNESICRSVSLASRMAAKYQFLRGLCDISLITGPHASSSVFFAVSRIVWLFFPVGVTFTHTVRSGAAPRLAHDSHCVSVSPSQAGTGWPCSVREPPPRSDESLGQLSLITKSTSWRSASCTRSICHRPTGTRSRSNWAWRTRRSSRGFRTAGPN